MPRKPRMYLPEIPAHIVQRGNNREPCFFAEDDYRFYLDRLGKALKRYHVKCHAYVLMTNHVHLLLTPSDEIGISKVMDRPFIIEPDNMLGFLLRRRNRDEEAIYRRTDS